MKVLYCNPIFFEYRLPFYKELVRLFKGDFYIMYSPIRYKICNKSHLCETIKKEMGDNAIPFYGDHVFDTNSKKWDVMPDIEKGKRIPFTWGLLKKINTVKPDVIITEGYFQWTPIVQLWALLHHVPIYLGYERTIWTERNNSKVITFIRKLQNKFIKGFIVNGAETKKYLESIEVESLKIFIGGMSADSRKLKMDVKLFRSKNCDKFNYGLRPITDSNGLLFLFVGVIAERKGIDRLLEVWSEHTKRYPKDLIWIVGDGNLYEPLKNKFNKDKTIIFFGKVDYNSVYKYYAVSDVFILPTIEDNWSLVVPEAMSCGLPVATSIYNGCHPELIHEGVNGCTFDTFNQESILKALDYFHHVDLKEHGRKSIEIEKEFNTENCARRVYDAITKQ